MLTEIPVVQIESAAGASVAKVDSPLSSERGFAFPIVLVLEDGQRIDSSFKRRLKRDVVAELASLPKAPEHPTKAIFDEAGAFFGTSVSFSLLGRAPA